MEIQGLLVTSKINGIQRNSMDLDKTARQNALIVSCNNQVVASRQTKQVQHSDDTLDAVFKEFARIEIY